MEAALGNGLIPFAAALRKRGFNCAYRTVLGEEGFGLLPEQMIEVLIILYKMDPKPYKHPKMCCTIRMLAAILSERYIITLDL